MDTTVGYWNEKKEKLKEKFPMITDEDLRFREGKEKEMMELLGYKLGKTHEELRNIFEALQRSLNSTLTYLPGSDRDHKRNYYASSDKKYGKQPVYLSR